MIFKTESENKKVPPHFIKTKNYDQLLRETKKMEYRVTGTLLTLFLCGEVVNVK